MSAFEYFIFINFISNYNTCFHNKLETLSCKKIKTCNINIILEKNLKTKN